jgi:hypothetical protein
MDTHKGFAMETGQTSPSHRSHQERTDQTRSGGGRNGIELGVAHAAFSHHLFNQMGQGLDMAPGCNFGDHSTPTGVLLNLCRYSACEDRLITHNSGC